ncbi:MAG: LysR family transcriptional regulator [Synergistaceae bacterium]|nr:LysR family transcriptional regulator [Synergistaceae bacterium]
MEAVNCRVLLEIAKNGNITKTAQTLGYTQAGVSFMIKKLEEECGFPLLFREKKGVRLTPEGLKLLPIIREIANWHELFEQAVAEIKGANTGTVRIGCYLSVAEYWLPSIIGAFGRDYPEIEVEVIEGGTSDIEQWIKDRDVDVGFLSARSGQDFRVIPLREEPMLALMPKDHPLAEAEKFPLSAFGDNPFILSRCDYDSDSHSIVEAYKSKFHRLPKIKISSASAYATIAMVANGLGVSVLAETMLKGRHEEIAVKEISPSFSRTVIMGVHPQRELSPAAAIFLEYAKRVIMK